MCERFALAVGAFGFSGGWMNEEVGVEDAGRVRRRACASEGCAAEGCVSGGCVSGAYVSRRCVSGRRGHELRAMAVEFPEVEGHPNRLPFEGCLTLVDVASDKAPSGARGHKVVLTREAAETALPSLLGMAVDFKAGWDGHDARQKCGIITSARLEAKAEGRRLMVAGYLYAKDYPEMEARLGDVTAQGNDMGMSYELADASVADMRAPVWMLTKATFTGAAILLREKAAYRATSFRVRRKSLQRPCRTSVR
jgi:hypothetical protein